MKKLFAILLVISMMFSLIPANLLTVAATGEDNENGVLTWSLTLKDDISVNFKMNIDESLAQDANAKVTASVGGEVYSWSAAYAASNVINVPVAAAQMTDTITISIVDGSGNTVFSKNYTARDYADYILENSDSASMKALVEAMLNYGAAAQSYFNYNVSNLANSGITASVVIPENDAKPVVVEDNFDGINFYGASLLMRNNITIRYYYTIDDGAEAVFTCNGKELTPVAKDGMYYVDVPVTSPALYCDDFVVTATSGDNALSVTYSVERYVKRMYYKSTASQAMQALAGSMFNYCKAAEVYINDVDMSLLDNYSFDNTAFTADVVKQNGKDVVKITNAGTPGNTLPKYWKELHAGDKVKINLTYESTLGDATDIVAFFYQMNAEGNNINDYAAGRRGKMVNGVMMTGDGDNYVAESTFTLEYKIKQDCSGIVMLLGVPAGTAIYINSIEVEEADPILENYDFANTSFDYNAVELNGEKAVKITSGAIDGGRLPRFWMNLKAGQTVNIKVTYESSLGDATDIVAFFYQMNAEGNNINDYAAGRRGKMVNGVMMTGDGDNYVAESTFTLNYDIQQDCSGIVMLLHAPQGTAIYIHSIEVVDKTLLNNYDFNNTAFAANVVKQNGKDVIKITNAGTPGNTLPKYWKELHAGDKVKINLTYESILGDATNMVAFFYQMNAGGGNIGEYNTGRRGKVENGVMMTGDGNNYVAEATFTLEYKIKQDCSGLVMLLDVPAGTAIYINSIEVEEADPILENYDFANTAFDYNAVELNGEKVVKITSGAIDGYGLPRYWKDLKAGQTVEIKLTYESSLGDATNIVAFFYQMNEGGGNIGEYNTGRRGKVVDGVLMTGDGNNYVAESTFTLSYKIQQDCYGLVMLLDVPQGTAIYIHSITVYEAPIAVTYDLNGAVGTVPETTYLEKGSSYGTLPVPNVDSNMFIFDGWYLDAACSADKAVTANSNAGTQNHTLYAKWSILGFKPDEVTYNLDVASINGQNAIRFTNVNTMPRYWRNLNAGDKVKITLTYESTLGDATDIVAFFYQMNAGGGNIGEYNTGRRGKVVDGVLMTGDGNNYVAESTFTLEYKIKQDCSGIVMLMGVPEGTAIYIHSIEVEEADPILENYNFANTAFDFNAVELNGKKVVKITSGAIDGYGLPKYWRNLNAGDKVKINLTYESTLGDATNIVAFFYQMNAEGNNINDYNAGRRGKVVDGVLMTGDGNNYAAESTFTLEYKIKQDCSGIVMLLDVPAGTAIYINSIEVEEADPILENYDFTNTAFDYNAVELNGEKVVKITSGAIDGGRLPRFWMNLKAGQTVNIKLTYESTLGDATNIVAFFYQMNAEGNNMNDYAVGRRGKVENGVMMTGDGNNYVAESTFTLSYKIQQDCYGLVMLLDIPVGTAIYIHSIEIDNYDFSNTAFASQIVNKNGKDVVKIYNAGTPANALPKYWKELHAGDKVKINLTYESILGDATNMVAFFYQMNAGGGNIGEYNTGRRGKVENGVMMTGDGNNYVAEATFTLEYKIKQDCSGLVMLLDVPAGTAIYINSIEVIEADPILENYDFANTSFDYNAVELNGEKAVKITSGAIDGSSLPRFWMNLKAGQTVNIKVTYESTLGDATDIVAFFYQMNEGGGNIGEYNTGRRGKMVNGVMMTGDGNNYVAESTFTLSYKIQQDCSGIVMLMGVPEGTAIYIHSIEVVDQTLLNNYTFNNTAFTGNVVKQNGKNVVKITNAGTSGNTLPKYWKELHAGDKVKINLTYESTLGDATDIVAFFYQMNAEGNNINDYAAGRRGKMVNGVMMTGDGNNYVAESTFTLEYKIKQDCSGIVMLLGVPAGTAIYINSIEVIEADPILEKYDYARTAFDFNAAELNGEKVVKITSGAIDGGSLPRFWKELKAGQTVEIKLTYESSLGDATNIVAFFYQMNADGGNIGEYNTGRRGKMVNGVMMTGDGDNYVAESTFTLSYQIQQDCYGLVMLLDVPQGTAIYIHSIEVASDLFEVPVYKDNKSISLGAWMGGRIAESTMKTNYWTLLKNANMNVALATPNTNVQQQLDAAYVNGVSVLVNERNWDGTVPSYADHSAFMGMCIFDEPAVSDFETLASQNTQWNATELANDMFFVNLYPSYADPEFLGEKWYDWGNTVTTYDRYVKDYIATVNPTILSLDYYPIVSSADTRIIRDSWFSDMDICAHYASQADIPFWYTLLSAGHLGVYETATVEELRWQMAVGQAYGAQGLMHFLFGPQGEDYTAMLDQNLENTTELYDNVAIANAEVAKWDHIYMNFTWKGTDTILGSNNKSNKAFDLCKYTKDVTKNSCVTAISSNEDLLCGMFVDGDNNQGFMLVNATDPAAGKDATVNITFEAGYTGALVIQKGVQRTVYFNGSSTQITVPSSEGIFIIPLA